jgi:hypothetical protein
MFGTEQFDSYTLGSKPPANRFQDIGIPSESQHTIEWISKVHSDIDTHISTPVCSFSTHRPQDALQIPA